MGQILEECVEDLEKCLSPFHHPGREIGLQCGEIFKNHRAA